MTGFSIQELKEYATEGPMESVEVCSRALEILSSLSAYISNNTRVTYVEINHITGRNSYKVEILFGGPDTYLFVCVYNDWISFVEKDNGQTIWEDSLTNSTIFWDSPIQNSMIERISRYIRTGEEV